MALVRRRGLVTTLRGRIYGEESTMPEPKPPYINKKSTPVARTPVARITGDQYLAARTHTVCLACAGAKAKTKLVAVTAPSSRKVGERCFLCGSILGEDAATFHTQTDIDYAATLSR